jgi:DNA-binding MarR family transcriptional regulator
MTQNRNLYEDNIVQSLRIIFQAIQQHSAWVEKNCGVSASQLWAMTELYNDPGLRVSDIANRLSIKKSTASNMLDKIQNKNYLERRRESHDQRVVTLYLTDNGKHLIENVTVPTQGVVLDALKQLSNGQIETLHESLGLLISKFPEHQNIAANVPVATLNQVAHK